MPNLINTDLGQNYRRTRVSTSLFGTRTIQLYEIWIYGLVDSVVDNLYDNSREIIQDDTDGIDQPQITELASGSIVEAILRGAQVMSELYIVGRPDYYSEEPNYNDLVITIGVSADTVQSGWEQYVNYYLNGDKQNYNPNATALETVIGNSVDEWATRNEQTWDYIDVYPVYLNGDSTETNGPGFALAKDDPAKVALRAAQKAKRAEAKASLQNPKSYAPKMKRPS